MELVSRRHEFADDRSVRAQHAVSCLDVIPDDFGKMIAVLSFNIRDNVKHPRYGMSGPSIFESFSVIVLDFPGAIFMRMYAPIFLLSAMAFR